MKIRQFYESNSGQIIRPDDKSMRLIEKADKQALEVRQIKKKVQDDSSIDFDAEKGPTANYNKKFYEEFRRKSAILRNLQDKIIQLDTEIEKLSPDIGCPSEAAWYEREILVCETDLKMKLDFFKNRMMNKRRWAIADCLRLGDGDMDTGLIRESKRLQEDVANIEDLKKKYNTYLEHEKEILKIIDKLCGE